MDKQQKDFNQRSNPNYRQDINPGYHDYERFQTKPPKANGYRNAGRSTSGYAYSNKGQSINREDQQKQEHLNKKRIEQRRRQARLKQNRRRAVGILVLIIITLILIAVMINSILNRRHDQSSFQFLEKSVLYESLDVQALFVRSENVEKTTEDGIVFPLVSEGTQVGYGQPIALVANSDITDIRQKMLDLQRQISLRQLELISQGQGEESKDYYAKADLEFRNSVRQIALSASRGDVRPVVRETLRINNTINERNENVNAIEFVDPVLSNLQSAYDKLRKSLESKSKVYITKTSGLVTYSTDGFETQLDFNKIEDLDAESITGIFADPKPLLETTGNQVEGTPIARVVNGINQAIILDLKTNNLQELRNKDNVELYFPDEDILFKSCQIVNKLPHDAGIYLIVRTEENVARFLRTRYSKAQLRLKSQAGLAVPISALRYIDRDANLAEIVLVQAGFAHVVKVEVGLQSGEKTIVTPIDSDEEIGEGDLIVQVPGSIKDGEKLE